MLTGEIRSQVDAIWNAFWSGGIPNLPLTPSDLSEFEKMLLDAGGSKALIDEAREQSQGLGLFVRSLVGLDREAAMDAFGELLQWGTATTITLQSG